MEDIKELFNDYLRMLDEDHSVLIQIGAADVLIDKLEKLRQELIDQLPE